LPPSSRVCLASKKDSVLRQTLKTLPFGELDIDPEGRNRPLHIESQGLDDFPRKLFAFHYGRL